MTRPDNDDHHERAASAPVGDDRPPVRDVLEQALDADDRDTKNYYIREALQLLHIDDRTETVRLADKALDAENGTATDFLVREALELLRIESTVAAARPADGNERAK